LWAENQLNRQYNEDDLAEDMEAIKSGLWHDKNHCLKLMNELAR
jgi:hypothetical protein